MKRIRTLVNGGDDDDGLGNNCTIWRSRNDAILHVSGKFGNIFFHTVEVFAFEISEEGEKELIFLGGVDVAEVG